MKPQADKLGVICYDEIFPVKELSENIKAFESFLSGDGTVRFRTFGHEDQYCVIFIDGMVNSDIINLSVIFPLSVNTQSIEQGKPLTHEIKSTSLFSEAMEGLLSGDAILLTQDSASIQILGTKGFSTRAIAEPDNEKALYGPREGFTESLIENTSMIRRRLQTGDLKFVFSQFGTRTNTKICVCYLESLVNQNVLDELNRRIELLCSEGVVDSHAIAENIRDSPYSLFGSNGKTERPDMAAAKLLDGGVALLVNGSPVAVLAPYFFIEAFKACDDRNLNFYHASASRLLRYLAFFLSISLGPIYLAIISFHFEVLPVSFMLTIAASSSGLPMPGFAEFLLMMTLFEMLRETGIRMSSKIGHSLSIVGALVIGQAAVEAKIVSAPMVIIVAITAICGLMIPAMGAPVLVIRLIAALAASFFGLFGYSIVMLTMLTHLFSLESMGLQYTAYLLPGNPKSRVKAYLRPHSKNSQFRTKFLSKDEKKMQKKTENGE
ncbi:MAG: spore germination protein [Oscillospiraceae bacterium]|nr:spore germination protein [Oscillospiraceae bacterium]